METLSPIAPVAFDRRFSIASTATPYYSNASTTSSSSPDLTSATTVSTALTNDSDDDSYRPPSRHSVVPKIEELDEDTHRSSNNDASARLHAIASPGDAKPAVGVVSLPPPRKKRGRPRKHPIVDPSESKRTSHARSKTGCGTCRRRKKKCDETKPACMNCEKNNVVCDGYEPKQHWRSGKQKALLTIPPNIPAIRPAGIDTVEDKGFLDHFRDQIGGRLSLTDEFNPFVKFIIPLALDNVGVMHGVLFLTSSCIVRSVPECSAQIRERREHHSRRALDFLMERTAETQALTDGSAQPSGGDVHMESAVSSSIQQPQPAGNALTTKTKRAPHLFIAQALILCLETVADGKCYGEWRTHINAMKNLLIQYGQDFPSEELRRFIVEFLLYHDYSSSITSLNPTFDQRSIDLMQNFQLPEMVSPAAGSLLGVLDGLFGLMSRIRHLRDIIRARRVADPCFCWISELEVQEATYAIDEAIREWKCCYPPDSPRFQTSLLYRQTTWVYLWRTAFASRPHPALKAAVDDGLKLLNDLPAASEDVGAMQSVLLMPVFLLGCAAFEQEQRSVISDAFARLKDWSSLGNIHYAQKIVEEVWELMDQGREDESWDWERLIARREWDLLVT